MDSTVVKAFALLELLAKSEVPLGVTDLARASDLGKSNVHRLLQTLRELGYVRSEDGAYEVTLRLWELGSYAHQRSTLRESARSYIEALAATTAETIHLAELDGAEVLYVDKIDSSEPVRAYTQLGGRAPAYCTATGKAILAYQHPDVVRRVLDDARAFSAATITDPDRFEDEAALIRSGRVALNRGEWREDIMGVASPIAGADGRVFAAVGISGPASRLIHADLNAIGERLVADAEKISAALGCSSSSWAAIARRGSTRNTR